MVISAHLCRGNFKSALVARGGYEPVAEILFNDMAIDGFFLEYDDERSGDFSPLRFVPKEKTVVLGLLRSMRPQVEDKYAIETRIDEAAQFVPLDQCALSHQCGFSSTAHGNELGEDDQWRKLARCVEVSHTSGGSERMASASAYNALAFAGAGLNRRFGSSLILRRKTLIRPAVFPT